jgi:hypothetical protein
LIFVKEGLSNIESWRFRAIDRPWPLAQAFAS